MSFQHISHFQLFQSYAKTPCGKVALDFSFLFLLLKRNNKSEK
jgi:hypothetical protein